MPVRHDDDVVVPRKLQREARDFLRPHEESVVEAIAHAFVRTSQEDPKTIT